MATLNTQFEYELKKLIDEELVRLRRALETRAFSGVPENYHYTVGQIDALKRVTDNYFDEATTEINKR